MSRYYFVFHTVFYCGCSFYERFYMTFENNFYAAPLFGMMGNMQIQFLPLCDKNDWCTQISYICKKMLSGWELFVITFYSFYIKESHSNVLEDHVQGAPIKLSPLYYYFGVLKRHVYIFYGNTKKSFKIVLFWIF